MPGFAAHIKEAILKNRERKPYYAKESVGKTRKLSNMLIALEYLVLPIAKYYDLRARKYNKQGIGIIKDDFVDMDIKPMELEARFRHDFSQEIYDQTLNDVREFSALAGQTKTLESIVEISKNFLEQIKSDEQKFEVHLAMLIHLIESVILIASNGVIYSRQSQGKTERLTYGLLKLHFIAIRNALVIDPISN